MKHIKHPFHRPLAAALTLLLACVASSPVAAQDYPLTQKYGHNPLFVDFPSPYFDKEGVGAFYSADPSARVWRIGGRDVLYVYCSHDLEPPVGCDRMDRYHVFSTEDLKTWTDHGEIFNAAQVNHQFSKEFPYAEGKDYVQFMWAPDCMYNKADQTYYYYFPKAVAWRGKNGAPGTEWKIFVAKSKDPATGFKITGYLDDAVSYIDPNVFLDDDGTLYFYQGGGAHLFGGKFRKDDWTKLDGKPQEMKFNGPSDFHEGAWVFKKDGIYYLTYPDNHTPAAGGNRLRYATSNSPLGPWTEKGIYMFPHGEETAHGSVVQFKGKWYQFYHTGNYSGQGNLRSVCVDELTFDKDGGLNVVENWGKPYGKPFAIGDKPVVIEAEHYNRGGSHNGYFLRHDNNGGQLKTLRENGVKYISSLRRQEWVRYSVSAKPGTYKFTFRVRQNADSEGQLTLALDGTWVRTGIPLSSKKDGWQDVVAEGVHLTGNEHYIELRGGSGQVEIDRITISRQ